MGSLPNTKLLMLKNSTGKRLRALANINPEMLRAYRQAVNAVTEYHNKVTAIRRGKIGTAKLKKKQLAAALRLMRFANSVLCKS